MLTFLAGMACGVLLMMIGLGYAMSRPTESDEAFEDLVTHHRAWRNALEIARDTALGSTHDFDDRGYWEHEIKAFDRTFNTLDVPPHWPLDVERKIKIINPADKPPE